MIQFGFASNLLQAEPLNRHSVSISFWGGYFTATSVRKEDKGNAKYELYLKPAITLLKFSNKTSLSAYSIMGLLRDQQRFTYNNKVKFALGLELRHKLSAAIGLSLGAQLATERMLYSGENNAVPVLTADMTIYKTSKPDWLRRLNFPETSFLLTGWANFRYPGALGTKEHHNFLVQGSFKLSVRQPIRNTGMTLAPFVAISVKADRKKRAWNNAVEPAIGIDVKTPVGKNGEITLGVKSSTQFRYLSGAEQSGFVGYIAWYKRF